MPAHGTVRDPTPTLDARGGVLMRLGTVPDLDATRDHWSGRPQWRPGRRSYAFHLTFERAPELAALAASLHPTLTSLNALDPVPARGLHLTLVGLGFTDEVTEPERDAVAADVFAAWEAAPRPELTFDGMLLAHESVMLTAAHQAWLDALVTSARDVVDAHLGPRGWGTFWPHMALAYCHASVPPGPILDALAPHAAGWPAQLTITPTLTLLRLARDEHVYTWDVLHQA